MKKDIENTLAIIVLTIVIVAVIGWQIYKNGIS